MSPELQERLIFALTAAHPLPWNMDLDWAVDVLDAAVGSMFQEVCAIVDGRR